MGWFSSQPGQRELRSAFLLYSFNELGAYLRAAPRPCTIQEPKQTMIEGRERKKFKKDGTKNEIEFETKCNTRPRVLRQKKMYISKLQDSSSTWNWIARVYYPKY